MKRTAIIAVIFFVLCSCWTTETATHSDIRTEYIRTYVPYALPADSATATALLECTESGQVILSKLHIEASKNARMNLTIDSLNNLDVNAIVRRDTLYIPSDSVIITKDILHSAIEYREKELTRWQSFKQEIGGWAFGFCLVSIIIAVLVYVFRRRLM